MNADALIGATGRPKMSLNHKVIKILNDTKYDGEYGSDISLEGKATPLFGTDWAQITLIEPAANASDATIKEVNEILDLMKTKYPKYRDVIKSQDIDNIEDLYVDLLLENDVDIGDKQRAFLTKVTNELTTIGLHYKRIYYRARPKQLIKIIYNIDIEDGKTTKSPSYPSTHAIIGRFLSRFLSAHYPEFETTLGYLGESLGKGRVLAGYHFPTDYYSGVFLADQLYTLIQGGIIKHGGIDEQAYKKG